jgi:hypothetical protein
LIVGYVLKKLNFVLVAALLSLMSKRHAIAFLMISSYFLFEVMFLLPVQQQQ